MVSSHSVTVGSLQGSNVTAKGGRTELRTPWRLGSREGGQCQADREGGYHDTVNILNTSEMYD